MTKKEKFLIVIFGAVTGFINGFFGGGGGMIVVPVMTILLKIEQKVAHATALAVILPVSIISALIYFFSGESGIRLYPTLLTSVGVIAGGILGALLLKKIDNKLLVKGFAVVMLIAGIKMIFP
jgi:uncharacterized membrane protein YfcA